MASFLIDASLPRPTAALVASYGHRATDVRDIGMSTASDEEVAAYAHANQLAILTADQDFGNLLDYPPDQYAGIVVVRPPTHAKRAVVLALVEQFLQQKDVVDQLSGRLVVIAPGRIRVRPAP
jgi:predicted nuclease of predicted toxin-antitoxin system